MEIKRAIVTGSTGAIGKAIVRQILSLDRFEVVMIARDQSKGRQVMEEMMRQTGRHRLSCQIADLSDKKDVYALAERMAAPVNLLVNNAAQSPRYRQETAAGIECQWATNVLGYYWMMEAFRPLLQAGSPSRIVNVASYWAGDLDLDDVEFRHRRYDNDEAYRQSKQADRMMAVALSEKYRPYGITVNSCHPGDVNSKLSNDLGFGGHETPDQGADTPVWLATSLEVEGITGKFFAHRSQESCRFSKDKAKIEQLMKLLEKY